MSRIYCRALIKLKYSIYLSQLWNVRNYTKEEMLKRKLSLANLYIIAQNSYKSSPKHEEERGNGMASASRERVEEV